MSYTINLTNGNVFATIPDGTINTTSNMTLIGKNYAGYGQFLDDNFIHLLENAANSSAPTAPLTGQLWFNTTSAVLNVYNGTGWKPIGGANAAASAPTNNTVGDLWYDTSSSQLNVWTGSAWLLVGPSVTNGTGALATSITDNASTSHPVIQLLVGNAIVGFVSTGNTFTPANAISGFTTIRPGVTLSTDGGVNAPLFQGTATNSTQFNSLLSSQFMRTDTNTATTGTLGVQNNTGLTVGANGDFVVGVSGVSNVTVQNKTSGGNLTFAVNIAGITNNAITISGTTGNVTIPNLVLSGGSSTFTTLTANTIVNGGIAGTGNIGSSVTPFNTIFAKATSAQYADLAERFAADDVYDAGTVVELGGTAEVTSCRTELSDTVFGVISTRAAYLMNALSGNDATHPPIAMTGRVPVQVVGVVRKGDRLVSAGNGRARAARPGEATPFTTIGRALADKLDTAAGTVEAIVTTK